MNNPHDFVVQWVKLNRDNPSDQTVLSYGATLVVKSRLNVSVIGTNEYKLEVRIVAFLNKKSLAINSIQFVK